MQRQQGAKDKLLLKYIKDIETAFKTADTETIVMIVK
jgi:hypothetical protein